MENPVNSLFKSKTAASAFAIIGVVMLSLAPASAATTVRDHRDQPVVRDHRAGQPEVRDHREASSGGGVTVKDSTTKRKPDCLGNLCHIKICTASICF
jgi:hypothetical protein